MLQNYAVPYKEKSATLVTERDIRNATLIICFEKKDYEKIKLDYDHTNLINIQMLGYYHPNGPLDIPDPLHFSDPKGYDKCYWMLYKSVKSLVKLLKEEEEAEARRKPKIVKLADPTIFTITSPSSWQKNKLKSPDIPGIKVYEPIEPKNIIFVPLPNPTPSPPQKPPPEITDAVNVPYRSIKQLFDSICDNTDIQVIYPSFEEFEDLDFLTSVDITPSAPQPPSIELEDFINRQSDNPVNKSLNHLLPPVLAFYKLDVPIHKVEYGADLLQLSPPQPPSISLPDQQNKLPQRIRTLLEDNIPENEVHMLKLGCDHSNLPSYRLSPPPSPDPSDEILDKVNKVAKIKKKIIPDPDPLNTPQPLMTPEEPIQFNCNMRQPGKKPLHPRHVVSCTHLHILVSCIFGMSPPPLDLDYFASPEPVRRGRGDIFDDVKHYRSFMK